MTQSERQRIERLKKINMETNALTRESIEIALIQLLATRKLDQISVTELVEKAGVSRGSFYRNFESKEAVLESGFQRIMGFLLETMKQTVAAGTEDEALALFRNAVEQIMAQSKLFGLLLMARKRSSDFNIILNYIHDHFPNISREALYALVVWAGALQNLFAAWHTEGMPEDKDTFAGYCYRLSAPYIELMRKLAPEIAG